MAKLKQTVTIGNMFYNLVYLNSENTLNNYFSEHMINWMICECVTLTTGNYYSPCMLYNAHGGVFKQFNIVSQHIKMFSTVSLVLALSVMAQGQRFSRDTGYGAPEPSYSAPEPSYSAPEPAYGPPEPAYSAPAESTGYTAPSYSAPAESLDLATLAIPILLLVGLFLLFPTYVNLTTVRRSFQDNGPIDLMKKVQDVYQAVIEDSDILKKYD